MYKMQVVIYVTAFDIPLEASRNEVLRGRRGGQVEGPESRRGALGVPKEHAADLWHLKIWRQVGV